MRSSRSTWLPAALLLLGAAPALAGVAPAGDELAIGTVLGQKNPAALFLGDHAVVAWEEAGGIVYQTYDENSAALGDEVVVAANDHVPPPPFRLELKEQHQPALAKRGSDFAVVWVEQTIRRRVDIFYEKRDLLSSRIFARVFDSAGTPRGPARQLAGGAADLSRPAVVAQGEGYWVAWQQIGGERPGVRLRRLDVDGAPGDQLLVSGIGARPALAANGNRLLVAWEQCCGGGGVKREIHARLVNPGGNFRGASFRVATGRVHSEQPAVTAGSGGEFLVAWQRSPDGFHARIDGQLISSEGAFVGTTLRLADGDGEQGAPRLLTLPDDGYLVTFTQWFGTAATAVVGATFDANGNDVGEAFAINQSYGVTGPYIRALAAGPDGQILAVWEGRTPAKQRRLRGRNLQFTE